MTTRKRLVHISLSLYLDGGFFATPRSQFYERIFVEENAEEVPQGQGQARNEL